jgi:hypothetical protein
LYSKQEAGRPNNFDSITAGSYKNFQDSGGTDEVPLIATQLWETGGKSVKCGSLLA